MYDPLFICISYVLTAILGAVMVMVVYMSASLYKSKAATKQKRGHYDPPYIEAPTTHTKNKKVQT